ncbi:MAG: hypothetical protein Q7S73_01305 [bacterium]|nr:hypothetical protein [bacterium]
MGRKKKKKGDEEKKKGNEKSKGIGNKDHQSITKTGAHILTQSIRNQGFLEAARLALVMDDDGKEGTETLFALMGEGWVAPFLDKARSENSKEYLADLMDKYLEGYSSHKDPKLPYRRGKQMAEVLDKMGCRGTSALSELEIDAVEGRAPRIKEVMELAGKALPVKEPAPVSQPEATLAA